MTEQEKLIAACNRLDAAYRSGTVREVIAAAKKEAFNELGGSDAEEVVRSEDSGAG